MKENTVSYNILKTQLPVMPWSEKLWLGNLTCQKHPKGISNSQFPMEMERGDNSVKVAEITKQFGIKS